MKTIPELIKEAQTLGVDIHDHVAEAMWGVVDGLSRKQAKQLTFCHLYGGKPSIQNLKNDRPAIQLSDPNVQNSKCPWLMTEEEIKTQVPKEFKQEGMGEPFEQSPVMKISQAVFRPFTSRREIRQSEDRMYRAGVTPYKVEVLDAAGGNGTFYTVHATNALDARCMAFILDGGCRPELKHWDDGHIELAITYTRIVE